MRKTRTLNSGNVTDDDTPTLGTAEAAPRHDYDGDTVLGTVVAGRTTLGSLMRWTKRHSLSTTVTDLANARTPRLELTSIWAPTATRIVTVIRTLT
ncbi:hypothetical protein [Klebsiella oxytoca]|uniref:hypothetical protein n=1 Tax=Klebsiella oxytoca TaxID=571 RepID=UPI0034A0C813